MAVDGRSMTLCLALLLGACSPPDPPVITPRSAEVTAATTQGLGLRVHCNVRNGNRIPLTVQRVSVHVTLAARDLGTNTLERTTHLPSRVDVPMDLDVQVPWGDLPGILLVTALNENLPYRLDGTARVGGRDLNIDVPFVLESTLPRSLLLGAAGSVVPGLGATH